MRYMKAYRLLIITNRDASGMCECLGREQFLKPLATQMLRIIRMNRVISNPIRLYAHQLVLVQPGHNLEVHNDAGV